jgi:hypothetical protein
MSYQELLARAADPDDRTAEFTEDGSGVIDYAPVHDFEIVPPEPATEVTFRGGSLDGQRVSLMLSKAPAEMLAGPVDNPDRYQLNGTEYHLAVKLVKGKNVRPKPST